MWWENMCVRNKMMVWERRDVLLEKSDGVGEKKFVLLKNDGVREKRCVHVRICVVQMEWKMCEYLYSYGWRRRWIKEIKKSME